ncbi:MAG: hypothetical protein IRY91_11235, partial [Gemmatimonadaceae bacterium]|nr:hypothetical protein [Gemmatimonadaceae bacterium]
MRLFRLSFTQKIILLPTIAAAALILVVGITVSLGRVNQERLESIRSGYYPSVQGSRSLQEILVALQRSLQDAVQDQNQRRLLEAEELSRRFESTRADLLKNPVANHAALDSIGRAFDEYYKLALAVAKRRINNEISEQLLVDKQQSEMAYNAIRRALGDITEQDTKAIEQAFLADKALQKSTSKRISVIAIIAMALLVGSAVYA